MEDMPGTVRDKRMRPLDRLAGRQDAKLYVQLRLRR